MEIDILVGGVMGNVCDLLISVSGVLVGKKVFGLRSKLEERSQ